MMKSPILYFVFLLIDVSRQCEDRSGEDFCLYILRKNDNMCDKLPLDQVKECMKTCGGCKPTVSSNNGGIPVWALTPQVPGKPRRPEKTEEDDGPLALPLYAVILIVVACLVIFIGVTVCVIKLKGKWKKRKMKKMDRNRQLLANAPLPANTMQQRYVWATGSHNGAYNPEMEAWVGSYYPETQAGYHSEPKPLNNSSKTAAKPEKKNINILQNGTKDKRKAPEPPKDDEVESAYQNLDKLRKNKTETANKVKSRAPAPPPSEGTKITVTEEIPVPYSESVFSEPPPKLQEQLVKESWNGIEPPTLPPRGSTGSGDANVVAKARKDRGKREKRYHEDELSSGEDQDDNSSVTTDGTLTVVTEDTSPALANILNQWKEHLQKQKKELEEYYRNLHAYVKRLGLSPVGAENDVGVARPTLAQSERAHKKRNKSEHLDFADRPYASIHENYIGSMNFPEPPESVRGDFDLKPNDEASQRQVIADLKKKLSRLQNLLESTQDAAEVGKKPHQLYQMSGRQPKPSKQRDGEQLFESRVTIKVLLQKLGERDRLKVQMRIAQALDSAKRRGGMNIASRDGPITCLSKQIHHVMNDILDPRTSTKIELGAHAAATLANKLLSNVHTDLLPILRDEAAKREVGRACNRISILTKQLLDMTKQLMARHTSYQVKDYMVYINALLDTTEKIMDSTFQLVCMIVDLQREERRDLVRVMSHTIPAQVATSPRQSLPPQTRLNVEKDQLLSRLRSESYCTSLSAVDVKRLNQDLAKLRQLLNTETKIPSFSGITTPRNPNASQTGYHEMVASYDEQDSDTLSTLSCSTCMPGDEDPYFYSEDLPPVPFQPDIPDLSSLVVPPKRKPNDTVQYSEIVFDDETHRPLTRPRKDVYGDTPPPAVQDAIETRRSLAAAPDHVSQIESAKGSQAKASTLNPSSFASFHSDRKPRGDDIQPRHQAMLARYFGTEEPQPELAPERTVDNLKEMIQDQLSPLVNAAKAMPTVGENGGVAIPEITMLPCGLVANDTPPLVNPPKEKKVRMPKIPKITVLRNGESELPAPTKQDALENRKELANIAINDHKKEVHSEVQSYAEQPHEATSEVVNEYSLERPDAAPYSGNYLEETIKKSLEPDKESSEPSPQDILPSKPDSIDMLKEGAVSDNERLSSASDSDSDESYKIMDDMLGQPGMRSSYNAPLFDYPNDSEDDGTSQGTVQRFDADGFLSESENSRMESRRSSDDEKTPSPSPYTSIHNAANDALSEGLVLENVAEAPEDKERDNDNGEANCVNAADHQISLDNDGNASGSEKIEDDFLNSDSFSIREYAEN